MSLWDTVSYLEFPEPDDRERHASRTSARPPSERKITTGCDRGGGAGTTRSMNHEVPLEARFAEMIASFGPGLRRLCHTYEVKPERQQELHQEIWLALWRALPTFRGDASLRTFVFRVAHNVAIKHVRTGKRDRSEPGLPATVPSPGTEPAEVIDRARQRARLLAAVRSLSDYDRQLAMLHLEGLTNPEIADVTGLSASNVGTRLSRVRVRLRAHPGGR